MKDKQVVAGLLFICCAGIVALLAYKGFNRAEKTLTATQSAEKFTADFADIIGKAKQNLNSFEQAFLNEQASVADAADTAQAFEAGRTLVRFWDSLHRYDISGYYYSRMYDKAPNEYNLMNASQRFYEYSTMAGDSTVADYYLVRASEGFKKVLETNPGNLDAKVGRALCIVTDRSRVMEAVPLLREVIKADSTHVVAIYTLGRLQIESGQLQKALVSFEKLVSLQPFNGEFYFYLAEVQQKMGNTGEAVINYEKAKMLAPDEETKKGVENALNELKKVITK